MISVVVLTVVVVFTTDVNIYTFYAKYFLPKGKSYFFLFKNIYECELLLLSERERMCNMQYN